MEKLYVDENFPLPAVKILRNFGHTSSLLPKLVMLINVFQMKMFYNLLFPKIEFYLL